MKKKIKPRVIGRFWEDVLFKCDECKDKFPPDDVALVANMWFDHSVDNFVIWCRECFDLNTEGDSKSWNNSPLVIVCGEESNG